MAAMSPAFASAMIVASTAQEIFDAAKAEAQRSVAGRFDQDGETAFAIFTVVMAYLLPAIIAGWRRHPNSTAIGALNLLLGWTGIGWAAAFVWALTNPRT
jgi:hypothetical protein